MKADEHLHEADVALEAAGQKVKEGEWEAVVALSALASGHAATARAMTVVDEDMRTHPDAYRD